MLAVAGALSVVIVLASSASALPPSVSVGPPQGTGGDFTARLTVQDVNDDGRPDVVATDWALDSSAGYVSILAGRGDGTFSQPVRYRVGALPYTVAAGDFNGDGRTDIAVTDASQGAANVTLLLRQRIGFRIVPYRIGLETYDIVAGDFDRNGTTDLAVASESGVVVPLGHGDGTFATHSPIVVRDIEALVAADMNGDEALDLVATVDAWRPRCRCC